MYDHPDYLTMGSIVNGLDDLDLPGDVYNEYVEDVTGYSAGEIMDAASHETSTILNTWPKGKSDNFTLARICWAVGFMYGIRVSRNITTMMLELITATGGDAYLGIDSESVTLMAWGRVSNLDMGQNPDLVAGASWIDGCMVGVHFDRARE